MLKKSALILFMVLVALPVLAQEPAPFKGAADLALGIGRKVILPPELMRHFGIPGDPEMMAGREVMFSNEGYCCRWIMEVFEIAGQPPNSKTRMMMVLDFPGEIRAVPGGGIYSPDGVNVWLMDENGKLKGTCHWVIGSDPKQMDAKYLPLFWTIVKDLRDWEARKGKLH